MSQQEAFLFVLARLSTGGLKWILVFKERNLGWKTKTHLTCKFPSHTFQVVSTHVLVAQ